MDIWQVLIDVVVLLGAGALLGALFERVGQSAILGYLLAGALLGPNVLSVVQSTEDVLSVSELGVALLLFAIGLEFSFARLRMMGRVALGGGVVQVLLTTAVGTGLAMLTGLDIAAAIAVGAICALSSTACVLRMLIARGELESMHGERALGILLVQDMAVVPLVLTVNLLAEGGSATEVTLGLLRTLGIGLGLVAGLWVLFHLVVPKLLASAPMHTNRELPLLVALVSGLGAGAAAHEAGVSPALGAFVAGILLAESPFAVQVRVDIASLKTLLLTLFFTAVGMLTDPAWIADNALRVAALVVLVVVGKAALVLFSLRLFEARARTALAAGIALGQLGEFSFVLASIARGKLFDEDTFLLLVSATVLTMFLSPFLVGSAPQLAAKLMRRPAPPPGDGPDEFPDEELGLVIGYGPAGRAAAERIAELGCRVVVIDQNPTSVRDAKRSGFAAVTGDARYAEVLEHVGAARAGVIVVTIPSADAALQIVRYVRLHVPAATLFVRARFHRSIVALVGAGAHYVIDEEHEVGRLIAVAYEEVAAARKVDAVEA